MFVHQRPGLREFLLSMRSKFALIVFTASTKDYADAVLNVVDPTGEFFMHRLYRHNCSNLKGYFLKNLNVS